MFWQNQTLFYSNFASGVKLHEKRRRAKTVDGSTRLFRKVTLLSFSWFMANLGLAKSFLQNPSFPDISNKITGHWYSRMVVSQFWQILSNDTSPIFPCNRRLVPRKTTFFNKKTHTTVTNSQRMEAVILLWEQPRSHAWFPCYEWYGKVSSFGGHKTVFFRTV